MNRTYNKLRSKYMKKFNAIDLFCGAGGLSLGFQQAGFNIIVGVDNEQAALDTF